MKFIWSRNKQQFLEESKIKAEESIFSQKIFGDDFVPIQISPLEILTRVIEHRRSPVYDDLWAEPVISEYPRIKSSQNPIMIEEVYQFEDKFDSPKSEELCENINDQETPKIKDKLHVYVLVHGLGGYQTDLLSFKNYITLVNPNSEFIISNKNSADNSEKDINELAENLAKEIESDIEFFEPSKVEKISFIGFSLGGIIIRAALPLISVYKDKFHSFFSLASPHLGLKIKEKYIAAGLWFMKVFSNKKCLEQLNLEDSDDIRETFMYKLSKSEGLSWFKKIYLISSSQDTYWPFSSWRIQVFNEQILDQNYSPELLDMAENILLKIKAESLTRVNTNFYMSNNYLKSMIDPDQKSVVSHTGRKSIMKLINNNFDKIIGKRAHCEFITNDNFAWMMVHRYIETISKS